MKRLSSIWLPVALLALTVMAAWAQDMKHHTFLDPLFGVQSEYVAERGANSEQLQKAKEESVASRLDLAIECFDVVEEEKVATLPEPLPNPDKKVATLPEPLPNPDKKVATLPEPLPLPDPEDKEATVNSKAAIPIPLPDPGSRAGAPALPDKKPNSQYAHVNTSKRRGETDEEFHNRLLGEIAMDLRKDPDSQDTSNPFMGNELLDWNAMVDRWEKTGVFGDMPPALKQHGFQFPSKVDVPKPPKASYEPESGPVPSAAYAPQASGQEEDVPQVLHLMFDYVQCADVRWIQELESGNSGLSDREAQALLSHCDQHMKAYQRHIAQRMNKRFAEAQARRLKSAAKSRIRSGVN